MSGKMEQVVGTFVDIVSSNAEISLEDVSLQALLACCDAARLTNGVLVETMPSGSEYVVTATRTDLANLFDDDGPLLSSAWGVLESGHSRSEIIDFANLPSSEVAMVLRLIGAKAMHVYPMRRRRDVVGALVLFDRTPKMHDAEASTFIQGVADVAATVADSERRLARATDMVSQLSIALESRVLIEQAKGVIAERHAMNQSEAFSWLRSQARNGRTGLRDVAHRVVQSACDRPELHLNGTNEVEHASSVSGNAG